MLVCLAGETPRVSDSLRRQLMVADSGFEPQGIWVWRHAPSAVLYLDRLCQVQSVRMRRYTSWCESAPSPSLS